MDRTGTAMATVLFTDVVESTAHRTRVGEQAADELFRRHERALHEVVAAHDGDVLKSVGDGVMAVFDAASDAVAAGVAAHRAIAKATPEFAVRVGIAAGDVSWESDDCFGLPVVVAKRLEGAAAPGTVLVSSVVRLMAGDRASVTYRPIEPLTLKGIDDPVDAFVVESVSVDTGRSSRFPPQLPSTDRPFAGRAAELDRLRSIAPTVRGDEPCVVLVAGEAGAGKTRLVTEWARELHRDGALVLCGLNDDELSLPYQPWTMVVEQLVETLPAEVLDPLRDDIAVLRSIHPRLDRIVPGLPKDERVGPDEQGFLVRQAIAALLRAAAALGPVVVVLDDLHWAGGQTIAVLRYLVSTDPVSGVLLVGTFRNNAGEVDPVLARVLADLRRVDHVSRVDLVGLDADAICTLIEADPSGFDPGSVDVAALAATISARTGGNAFLVSELCRHLHLDGDAVPESVREVVSERVQKLSAVSRQVAETVAVAAGRVSFSVLRSVLGDESETTATAVTELVDSGLLQEVGGVEPAYQFSHALLRDGIADGLGAAKRQGIHLALANALEQVHESDRRPVLPALADHFAAAAAVGGLDKAVYYGRRAAAQARRTAAYAEALNVLRVVQAVVPASTLEHIELSIEMIDLMQRSGHIRDGLALTAEAFAAAGELGDLRLQGEIAMHQETLAHLGGIPVPGTEEMLEHVLNRVGDSDPVFSAQLHAAAGRARVMGGRIDTPALLESLRRARELDDTKAVNGSLEALLFDDRDASVVLGFAEELTELTLAADDPWHSMWGTSNQLRMLLRLGRLDDLAARLEAHRTRANRYGYQIFSYMGEVFGCLLAHANGDFAKAESFALRSEEIGVDSDDPDQYGIYGLLMFAIRREQGRLEEMRPVLQLLAKQDVHAGVWAPGLALAYAELGMRDEASGALTALAADRFASVPRDTMWPAALGFLVEAVMLVEDRTSAELLLGDLEAHAGQALVGGFSTCLGPADRLRAGLCELTGRHAQADEAIVEAHEFAATAGAALWRARASHTNAWICARRGDAAGARRHHEDAVRVAEPIDMRSVLEPPLLGNPAHPASTPPADAPPPLPDGLTAREVEVMVQLADGCSNQAIADRLHISPNTAANHVRSILVKTGSANRTEAATYAIRHGLATADR